MGRRDRIRDLLMARVVVDETSGCWIWQGRTSGAPGRGRPGRGHSYPRVDIDGGTMAAHRAMWIVEHGPIPPRKQLDHACRNRLCIRPDPGHNELVTHLRNQLRRADYARRMRCEQMRDLDQSGRLIHDDPTSDPCPTGPADDSMRGGGGAANAQRPVSSTAMAGPAGAVSEDVSAGDRRALLLPTSCRDDRPGAVAERATGGAAR